MKKFLSLMCVAISITLTALAGCSDSDVFTAKHYAAGESIIESVIIDVADRQLDVGVSDDGQVHVDYFDGEKEYLEIGVSENNTLTVKLLYDKAWTDFIGTKAAAEYRKICVKLPATVTALSVNTTNESIKIEPLTFADSVTVSNNGGDIKFDKISVGKALTLTAKNGDIKGSVIGGWDDFAITCTIKKGESNLPAEKVGGGKRLKTDCNNGDINIEFVNG